MFGQACIRPVEFESPWACQRNGGFRGTGQGQSQQKQERCKGAKLAWRNKEGADHHCDALVNSEPDGRMGSKRMTAKWSNVHIGRVDNQARFYLRQALGH